MRYTLTVKWRVDENVLWDRTRHSCELPDLADVADRWSWLRLPAEVTITSAETADEARRRIAGK